MSRVGGGGGDGGCGGECGGVNLGGGKETVTWFVRPVERDCSREGDEELLEGNKRSLSDDAVAKSGPRQISVVVSKNARDDLPRNMIDPQRMSVEQL